MTLAFAVSILLASAAAAPDAHEPMRDTLDHAEDYKHRETNTPEARRAIESYGQCVARREPGEANRLLTMDFRTSRYRTGLRLLAEEVERECARDAIGRRVMRSAGLLFSGAVAEALLETDATPLNARIVRNAAAKVKSYSPTDAAALCIARSMPDHVATLFATAPGSEAEAAAAAPIAQIVPTCARAVGISAKLEISVPALRAMIATASYRLIAQSGDSNA